MTDNQEGTRVANGQHIVPPGIAVEPFSDNFKEKLAKTTPVAVSELLQSKDLIGTYQKLASKAARGQNQHFSEVQLIQLVQNHQPKFEEKGVTVAICLFTSDMGDYRWFWLEFIDHTLFPSGSYKPKYEISNYRVVLDGAHAIPPQGVAVEHLSDWSTSKLTKECPQDVQELLTSKMLTAEYDRLVETLGGSKQTKTSFSNSWKTREVAKILHEFQPKFESKGIELVVCKKPLSVGWEDVKWLEFIDIELAPEHYFPKYSVDQEYQSERMQQRNTSVGSQFFGGMEAVREALVTEGIIEVGSECPEAVAALLDQKGISETEYGLLDEAISQSKSMRNFLDLWRLTVQQIVEFSAIKQLLDTFKAKGVKMLICESLGKSGKTYWLEYVDTSEFPDYKTPYDIAFAGDYSEGRQIDGGASSDAVKGWLVVPEGVYVEGLNGVKKLSEACPPEVRDFLTRKGLSTTYDEFIDAIVKSKKTRNWAKSWKSEEICKILNEFQELFLFKGVKLVLCKIIPDGGQPFRWFEFIDLSMASGYVSQYDYENVGPAELETHNTTLKFPKGIAVEKLTDHKSLIENIPEPISEMMAKRQCMDLYFALVECLCRGGNQDDKKVGWSEVHMREVVNVLGPKFESKGVSVFLSAKVEEVYEEPPKAILWIEFVDREIQPNYVAQRGVDMKKVPRHGINPEELISLSLEYTATAVTIGFTIAESMTAHATLNELIQILKERNLRLGAPSMTTADKTLYMQKPPALEKATRKNLDKLVS
ncbi:MAG: hypothetical protein SGBAC_010811 [Bacillariaceae sp.]